MPPAWPMPFQLTLKKGGENIVQDPCNCEVKEGNRQQQRWDRCVVGQGKKTINLNLIGRRKNDKRTQQRCMKNIYSERDRIPRRRPGGLAHGHATIRAKFQGK